MEAEQLIDLDAPLVKFGGKAHWSIRAACEGTLILGGIGSGKTSGSYALILRNMLREGFGGLLLTVKPQEAQEYRRLCQLAGRERDLIEIKPGGKHSFNWLEYEASTKNDEIPLTDNIVEIFNTCIKASAEKNVGRGDDGFWQSSLTLLIGHVVDLCLLAHGKVNLDLLYHIVQSLPTPSKVASNDNVANAPKAFEKAWELAKSNVDAKRHKWHNSLSKEERTSETSASEYEARLHDAVPEARTLDFLAEFFFGSFKQLSEKTRSIITFIFSGFVHSLLREPVYSLFAKRPSTVTPEDCYRGKIILVNLPVKKYFEVGKNVQMIVKLVCQRAWERREITEASIPVFLAADEAYSFTHEHDALFQATARSARVCTLQVSQNLSNYYAAMGGEQSKYRVNSLISTLATRIFHANTDIDSNDFAATLIGESFFTDPQMSVSMSSENYSQGQTLSVKLQKIYRPEFFSSLRCGGPNNNYNVEAVIHRQGDPISGNNNYALINIKQHLNK